MRAKGRRRICRSSADRDIGRFQRGAQIYFAASPRALSVSMLRAALRAEARSLVCLTPFGWVDLPLHLVKRVKPGLVRGYLALERAGKRSQQLAWRCLAPSGPVRVFGGQAAEHAFEALVAARPAPIVPIPRRVVLVCGNLSLVGQSVRLR